ncbi:uncharacterized protein LOC143288212 [Babylonia areolata]|uniref:uncharacterized protein LOC143288212 n=1 Tax=Babylonia areolata TaxID=304850 RepID=UPI003FD37110
MTRAQSPSMTLVAVLSVLSAVLPLTHIGANGHGNHGGVPMGHINPCDDAKTMIAIDWDPDSFEEYTCDGGTISQTVDRSQITCESKTQDPIHVCYPEEINYTSIPPTSGRHRPNWADYGEYRYVPPQRWLHNLEHGTIVMLYHPCADPGQVEALRRVVTGCLRRHIITPYRLLPRDTPFALVSWGCKLMMGQVDTAVARQFIKDHGLKDGPEGQVSKAGLYTESLIVPAKVVSDYSDSVVCPDSSSTLESRQPGSGFRGDGDESLSDLPFPRARPLPILVQSMRRRQQLDRESAELQRSFQRLERVFRQLMDQ